MTLAGGALSPSAARPERARAAALPWRAIALALLPVALAALVYRSVLRSYFFADDWIIFFTIANGGFWRFVLEPFGGHVYLVRNAILFLCYKIFGLRSEAYFLLSLLTHLFNVALLFRVVRAMTGSLWLACFGAALWGTSPLEGETINWFCVYGQVVVLVCLLYILGDAVSRDEVAAVSTRRVLAWYALLLAAATCFGIGLGLTVAMPIALLLIVPALARRRAPAALLLTLPLAAAGLYAGLQWLWTLVFDPLPFNQVMMLEYATSGLAAPIAMVGHLLAYGITALLLGFFYSFAGYSSADDPMRVAAWIVTPLFGLALLFTMATGGARQRRWMTALVLIALAIYGSIAVGRANILAALSITLPQAATTSRYHYAASAAVTLLVCAILGALGERLRVPARVAPALLLVSLAVAGYGYATSSYSLELRESSRYVFGRAIQQLQSVLRETPDGRTAILENASFPRFMFGPMFGHHEFPGLAGALLIAFPKSVVQSGRIAFVEQDESVLEMAHANRGLAIEHLLLSPTEAAARGWDGDTGDGR